MYKTKVVCLGEALIDRIKNKTNKEFTDYLGGAPANVACALRKLKIDSVFIGCLGSDDYGNKFIDQFNQLKVNVDFLQVDKRFPTRIVKVERDHSGDRFFSGFDASPETIFADEAINKSCIIENLDSLNKLFSNTKYFVSGTNVLSSLISKESCYFLLEIAKKYDVKVIIDLNWREVFWNYSNFSSKISKKKIFDLIQIFLNYAHILKLAKEEALQFFNNENPLDISKKLLNRPDVIITNGSEPISWYINGFQGKTKIINSSMIIDTTGAGDAFLSGFISKLILSGYPSNKLEIVDYVRFASACGLLTCLGEGAIEQQPDYSKVNEFLGSQIL